MAKDSEVELAPGQIWSIRSEPPTTAKVIIGRIEPWLDRTSVHVSIVDVPVPDGRPNAGSTTTFGHIPFDEAAIIASLDQLLGTDATPPPIFKQGYQQWQDDGGGVFTVSVAEVIELAFRAMAQ